MLDHDQPHQCPIKLSENEHCVVIYAGGGFSAHANLMVHLKHTHKVKGRIPCHKNCEYIPSMDRSTVNYPGKWLRSMRERRPLT